MRRPTRFGLAACVPLLVLLGAYTAYWLIIVEQIKSGVLRVVLPDWPMDALPINAVFPNRQDVPAKVRAFVGFIRSVVKDLG